MEKNNQMWWDPTDGNVMSTYEGWDGEWTIDQDDVWLTKYQSFVNYLKKHPLRKMTPSVKRIKVCAGRQPNIPFDIFRQQYCRLKTQEETEKDYQHYVDLGISYQVWFENNSEFVTLSKLDPVIQDWVGQDKLDDVNDLRVTKLIGSRKKRQLSSFLVQGVGTVAGCIQSHHIPTSNKKNKTLPLLPFPDNQSHCIPFSVFNIVNDKIDINSKSKKSGKTIKETILSSFPTSGVGSFRNLRTNFAISFQKVKGVPKFNKADGEQIDEAHKFLFNLPPFIYVVSDNDHCIGLDMEKRLIADPGETNWKTLSSSDLIDSKIHSSFDIRRVLVFSKVSKTYV